VQVIRHNRLAEQINSKVLRLMNKLFIDPDFSMVIILPGDGIITQQKATSHSPVHDVDNCNLICRKNLNPRQPSHDSPRQKIPTTAVLGRNLSLKVSTVDEMLCPQKSCDQVSGCSLKPPEFTEIYFSEPPLPWSVWVGPVAAWQKSAVSPISPRRTEERIAKRLEARANYL